MANDYRADQVGSLLRPAALKQAREEHAAGQLSAERLRADEDRAILDALAMQRAVGIDVVTDGEFRRFSFMSDLAEAVEGFVPDTEGSAWHGADGIERRPGGFARVIGGKLHQTRRLTAHEVGFLKEHAGAPFKMTVPSAGLFASARGYRPALVGQVYPTRADLLRDLVAILSAELRALADEGVPYLQIDAPSYTHLIDEGERASARARGLDPDELVDQFIAADNACLQAARRDGVTLAIHLCRGNSRSRWLATGGYDPIAEKLFGTLAADRFLLEYDSERAGSFEPLRFVPPGKTVVLGLVTTKHGGLEDPGLLVRRIEEAARYVPVERLALSPQCGFASSVPGNLLTEDDERRKLELVVETARRVWG
ncbi:MAG TPA: 5-methyltetrahydropteroyltriglutamate--homocysteine S-methyltransferase [Chloroflexota bacterium]|jgi:5-methyltetrahydropteroyltriglutamate--homocysteine methyltransferase